MAPPTRRQKKRSLATTPLPPPVIDPADRLSKLPEEILAHILSFLPAQEAVRTCVLARTWRGIWKFTRCLRITGDSVHEVREFVDRLLCVRLDGLKFASLYATEIRFPTFEMHGDSDPYLDDKDMSNLNRWIHRVLKCQIRMLQVNIYAQGYIDDYLQMGNRPLVSQHLTRLELTGVWFVCRYLDLDGCHELEHLEIVECHLESVTKIMSLSLKCLIIKSCDSSEDHKHIQICVPHLISLCLDDNSVWTPLLERMPELVEAKLRINLFLDSCHCEDPMACCHLMWAGDKEGSADYIGQNTTKCVVLEGLAQAKDLALIAGYKTFIFRRDLRWCPTFSKLKTLVLNHDYWCQPPDCSALACILEHAPLLEKLTLIPHQVLPTRGKYKVEMEGHPDAAAKSNKISQHLKIVKIKCEEVNGRFLNILNFLATLNICFDLKVAEMMKEQLSH